MGKRSRRKGGHPADSPRARADRERREPHDDAWDELARAHGLEPEEIEERREQLVRLLEAEAEMYAAVKQEVRVQSYMLAGVDAGTAAERAGLDADASLVAASDKLSRELMRSLEFSEGSEALEESSGDNETAERRANVPRPRHRRRG